MSSARTFALIGFIFFAIMAAIWAMVTAFVLATTIGVEIISPGFVTYGVSLALSVGFAAWSWSTLKDIDAGDYGKAQTPALLLGILGLFPPIGAIIAGVFFILVFWKLNSAMTYAQVPPPFHAPVPASPAGRICTECGRAIPLDAKFCPHCGKELA